MWFNEQISAIKADCGERNINEGVVTLFFICAWRNYWQVNVVLEAARENMFVIVLLRAAITAGALLKATYQVRGNPVFGHSLERKWKVWEFLRRDRFCGYGNVWCIVGKSRRFSEWTHQLKNTDRLILQTGSSAVSLWSWCSQGQEEAGSDPVTGTWTSEAWGFCLNRIGHWANEGCEVETRSRH